MTKDDILTDKDKKQIAKHLRDVEARIAKVQDGTEYEPIEPLQEQRQELKEMIEELKDIQLRETKLKTEAFIKSKKHHLEELQKKVKEDEDEDKYFTTKPDKEGIIKVKEGKYKIAMDMLQEDLKEAKNAKDVKTIKEKIKFLKENKTLYKEIIRLKGIKAEVFAKNFMKKLPDRMQKFSKYASQISGAMGDIGGDVPANEGYGDFDNIFGDSEIKKIKKTKKSGTKKKNLKNLKLRTAKKRKTTRKLKTRKEKEWWE